MNKSLTAISVILMMFFSLCVFTQAQDKDDEEKPKIDPKKEKKYELKPVFKKDMTWKETLIVSMTAVIGQKTVKMQSYNFKMDVKVKEIKDKRPSKIEYTNITGTLKFKKRFRKIKDGYISGKVDSSYLLKNATMKKIDEDFLNFFPAGPIIGFVPPKNKIKVGETWDSKKLIPVGQRAFEGKLDESLDIMQLFGYVSSSKGTFKLEKVEKDKKTKKEFAVITWTGSADIKEDVGQAKVSWKRIIKFDNNNKLVLSNSGSIKITMDVQGQSMSFEVKYDSKLEHPKSAQTQPKDKTAPDKPKGDDDE